MTYRARNIGIAVALAIVAALLTSFYVTNYKHNVQSDEKLVDVYVAKQDIPAGTTGPEMISRGLFATSQVPRKSVVPGAISQPNQVKDYIAAVPTYRGEQITLRRLGPIEARGIRGKLKDTQRAITVPGDPFQLMAGTLHGGDHVDVVGNINVGNQSNFHVTRIVLRNLLVLKTSSSAGGKLTSGGASGNSVTLAVTDNQVQKLYWVMKNGDFTLELRPPVHAQDSPESVEWSGSITSDGLKPAQIRQLLFGKDIIRRLISQEVNPR